ncbi:MAG: hypothetical protein R2755_17695 [Acidimicrobiales bacterium]
MFDSTGWALEDLVVAELFTDLARSCAPGGWWSCSSRRPTRTIPTP